MLRENSDTGLRTQQLQLVRQHDATDGLPSGKEDKKDDWSRFQLSSASTSFTSAHQSSECTRALLFCCCARRSAQKNFPRHELVILRSHACRTQDGYVKCPTREDSNSNSKILIATRTRNLQRTSKHLSHDTIYVLTRRLRLQTNEEEEPSKCCCIYSVCLCGGEEGERAREVRFQI